VHILVTAGPTREYIDPVRFLSNPSTGRMGFAVARAAASRGHRVSLVSGPVALRSPKGVETIAIETTEELAEVCARIFKRADAAVMTAAVCDYRPRRRAAWKQKKTGRGMALELTETTDVAALLGRLKKRQKIVCFAVEDRAMEARAHDKLIRKNADLIVANSPVAFGALRSDVCVIGPEGLMARWKDSHKQTIARRLIRWIESGRLAGLEPSE
jgi:phosphopantothenoylcysteine decarboxylase/phosphopantothenate--cysteine ligase